MAILLLTLSTFGFVLFRDLSRRLRGDIDKLLESRAQGVRGFRGPVCSKKTLEELNVPLIVF
jgi:hypothetical protein